MQKNDILSITITIIAWINGNEIAFLIGPVPAIFMVLGLIFILSFTGSCRRRTRVFLRWLVKEIMKR